MAETTRKPTNKGKFSLYMDKTLMQKIQRIAERKDRSVNYVVERALEKEFL